MCLHDDFQGLGDKENMYMAWGLFYHINSVNGWHSYAYTHKKVICKGIFI